MIKKTLDSHKKTLDYKSKLTHSENAQKMGSNDNHRHYARKLIGNQRQKKREIAVTVIVMLVFVCTSH